LKVVARLGGDELRGGGEAGRGRVERSFSAWRGLELGGSWLPMLRNP